MRNPDTTNQWTRKRFLTDLAFVAGALVAAALLSNYTSRIPDEPKQDNLEQHVVRVSNYPMPGR
jgi:hypothetical protein